MLETVKNWCKIFTLENDAQVLITKDYDSDKEMYLIRIQTSFEIEDAFVGPSVNLSYEQQENRDEKFDLITQEEAIKSYNLLKEQIEKMLD